MVGTEAAEGDGGREAEGQGVGLDRRGGGGGGGGEPAIKPHLLEQALPRQRVRLELDGERLELRRHARCRGELLTGDGQALVALQTHLGVWRGEG